MQHFYCLVSDVLFQLCIVLSCIAWLQLCVALLPKTNFPSGHYSLSWGLFYDFNIKEYNISQLSSYSLTSVISIRLVGNIRQKITNTWSFGSFIFHCLLSLSDFTELSFAHPLSLSSVLDHPQDLCTPQLRQLLSPIFNPLTPPSSSSSSLSPISTSDSEPVNISFNYLMFFFSCGYLFFFWQM